MSRKRNQPDRCRRSVFSACALAVLTLALGTAAAQRSGGGDAALEIERPDTGPRLQVAQDGPISLDEAVELVRREFEGRVVSAETRSANGRRVHVIRIFDNVRVRDVHVDAETGRIRRR